MYVDSLKLVIGNVYMNTKEDSVIFFEELGDSLNFITANYRYHKIVIVGDWNARVGLLNQGEVATFRGTFFSPRRNSMDVKVDTVGRNLVDIMEEHGFMMANGRSKSDQDGCYSFLGSQGQSTIDMCWLNINALNNALDFSIESKLGLVSDHSDCCLTMKSRDHLTLGDW